jgi:hypothetical protein
MADKPSEQEVNAQVAELIDEYRSWAIGINLTLTKEEIAAKEAEFRANITGDSTALVTAGNREAESWDDVAALVEERPEEVTILDDYLKLDNKKALLDVPFWINRWWFTDGDQIDPDSGEPRQFAVLRVLVSKEIRTESGDTNKVVVTDGSTGIYQQLRKITQKTGKTGSMMVRHGLRVSQYTAATAEGPKQAETFYLT